MEMLLFWLVVAAIFILRKVLDGVRWVFNDAVALEMSQMRKRRMKTSRRAFLGATIAGLTYPVCASGKVVAKAKEPDIQWKWVLGPWQDGRREWRTSVGLRLKLGDVFPLSELFRTTNQRAFCGIRKDCLLLGDLSWVNEGDGTGTAKVVLTEWRRAYGYANLIDIRTGRRTKRLRVYGRTNFQEIMPGRHTVVPAQGVDHTAWIEPDQAVLDAIKKHQADGKSRPGDNYHFNVAFDL